MFCCRLQTSAPSPYRVSLAIEIAPSKSVAGGGVLEVLDLGRRHPLSAHVVLVAGVDGDLRSLGSRTCIEGHGTPNRDQGGSVCRGPHRVSGPRSRRPTVVIDGTISRLARGCETVG